METKVTKERQSVKDEYGVVYSHDGNRLLKCNNKELTEYTVKAGTKVIWDEAFDRCKKLESINLPKSVTSIGEHAFDGCSSLTSIELPERVTTIEDFTFGDCINLTSINLPDGLISIGDCAFAGCTSLTSIELPKSVTSIGLRAFHECTNLVSVELPESVTSIANYAFDDCTNLVSITFPEGLTSCGVGVFNGCDHLEKIYITCSIENYKRSVIEKFSRFLWNKYHKVEIVIKYKYFYFKEYLPARFPANDSQIKDNRICYNFKDGILTPEVKNAFLNKIKEITQNTTDGWVICFIPASTAKKTAKRFKKLATAIRRKGYEVAQDAIFNEYDTEAGHLSGKSAEPIASFGFDATKFSDKKVILIDDIITRGTTFVMASEKMRSLGAISVIGLFLAETTYPPNQ